MEITLRLIETVCTVLTYGGLGGFAIIRLYQGELLWGIILLALISMAIGVWIGAQ